MWRKNKHHAWQFIFSNRHSKPSDAGLEYAGHRVEAMETQG